MTGRTRSCFAIYHSKAETPFQGWILLWVQAKPCPVYVTRSPRTCERTPKPLPQRGVKPWLRLTSRDLPRTTLFPPDGRLVMPNAGGEEQATSAPFLLEQAPALHKQRSPPIATGERTEPWTLRRPPAPARPQPLPTEMLRVPPAPGNKEG